MIRSLEVREPVVVTFPAQILYKSDLASLTTSCTNFILNGNYITKEDTSHSATDITTNITIGISRFVQQTSHTTNHVKGYKKTQIV